MREMEAILFAAGYPVAYEKLASVLGISEREVCALADAMTQKYEDRGIQLVLFDRSCQLCTREEYEAPIRQALGIRGSGGLSNSCLEVLAIVAYNQPVTRAFIEQVRGSDSAYAIGVLSDKQLIEVTGRLDVPGKPMLFSTTEAFLRVFGLHSLAELPASELPGMAEAAGASVLQPAVRTPEEDPEKTEVRHD